MGPAVLDRFLDETGGNVRIVLMLNGEETKDLYVRDRVMLNCPKLINLKKSNECKRHHPLRSSKFDVNLLRPI